MKACVFTMFRSSSQAFRSFAASSRYNNNNDKTCKIINDNSDRNSNSNSYVNSYSNNTTNNNNTSPLPEPPPAPPPPPSPRPPHACWPQPSYEDVTIISPTIISAKENIDFKQRVACQRGEINVFV